PPMDEPAPRVETRTEPAKAAGPVKAADPFDLAAQAPSARAAASEPDPFVIPVEEESQSGSSGPSYELSVDEAEPKRDAVPTYELSLEDAVSPVDHSSELPQELQRVPAAASVPAPAPAAPPPAASPAAASPVSEDVDIDIDIDEASAPAAAAPSGFAPPGLRRRQSSPGTPAAPPSPTALPPPAAAAPPLAAPPGLAPAQRPAPAPAASSRFDELDLDMAASVATRVLDRAQLQLDGDSLLHAVEAAARAALSVEPQPGPGGHEETVFTTEELAEAPHPGALPKIPLFSDLPPDAFIELFERCPLRRFSINATIIQQGSQGDSFFVICEGSVRVTREDEGERKELAILNEGAFFGEMALLSDAPRTASVESAAEDTQLLEISAQLLAELSSRYPSVAQALKKFCRQRMLSNVMNTSALFRPFNRGDRKQLVERFRARDVKKNDTIIREGDRTDGLYVLLSGEVEVRKGHQALARLKEGEIFGEMSLLQKSPATATVAATKRTSLLRLPREDFDELILSHPQILILVAELTEDRRRQTEAVLSGAAVHGEEGLLLV
ncbi:MAG TPA: cyclic nucleotide-binding domain-containing protein, partial [Myxococcaceae bacterium]|nr:cyclic nucleotide-binding domain-containing protein [Myxococcaceae bacterium]